MRHPRRVVTRTMLLEQVWDLRFDPQTNVIDTQISRLRAKIDRGFDRALLRTSAVRLALCYALLYAALVALALGTLYWSTSRFVDAQLVAGLGQGADALTRAQVDLDPAAFRLLLETERKALAPGRLYVLLADAEGRPLAGDLKGWPAGLPVDDQVHNVLIEDALIPGRAEDADVYWPALGRRLSEGRRLLVTHDLDQAEALLDFVQGTLAAVLAVSVALALGLGLLQGRRLLARIDTLITTARAIGAGRLNRRVPVSGRNDEFDELAGQLNAVLERIEALLGGMRRVTDNLAHDLRRPLSRVRNLLDVTAREARDGAEYRVALVQASADLGEVVQTFNALTFSPPGTPLRLEVAAKGARVQVRVGYRGPGIPTAERHHVLQRFVRLDAARSTPGSGLGLSLVAAVARLHGADLTLADAKPGLIASLDFTDAPHR